MSYRYPATTYAIQSTPTEQQVPVNRYSRNSFDDAGVDNFSSPPGQDPEMMEVLTNVLPVASSSLQRRFGYSFWMNPTTKATHIYDYLSDLTGKREVLLTSPLYVRAQNDDGSDYNTNLFTPTAQATAPRAVTSRSYSYFANGQAADYLKWDGSATGGVTKWGIDINDIGTGTTAGPETPTTVADIGAGGPSGSIGPLSPTTMFFEPTSGEAWVNEDNAKAFDNAYATASLTGGGTSGGAPSALLEASGFGFNVPSGATITGVVAEINWGETPYYYQLADYHVFLLAGSTIGDDRVRNYNPGYPYAYYAYGSASDLWGATLTPAIVNAGTFGFAFQAQNTTTDNFDEDGNNLGGAGNDTASIDHMRMTVYYDMPPATPSWTDPNNVKVEDGLVATADVTTAETSQLQMTDFGFAISGADAITGIEVKVKAASDTSVQLRATLMKNGLVYGETKSHPVTNSTLDFLTYGDAQDLWNGVWTPTDINLTNFGVNLTAIAMSGSVPLSIDFVEITVYLGTGPITLGAATGGGNITLVNGRVYFGVFENSLTGHYSDLTPESASTGVLTAKDQPLSNLPVSVDPQVDTFNLLATADGGDETRLYLISSMPNGTTTYTDTMSELDLLAQPVFLSTDATGREFGVTGNDPPPVGAQYPTKHRGRLYLLNGPTLYWSKALEDITTDTSYIAGRWEEAFPPENSADVSEGAENGRGMLSDGINLYIGTEFKIRRLNGDAPFLESPDIVHNEVGIMNQDVWKITYLEGTPVGAMWLTPDLRIISSDFNTYKDVSTPIQGTLATVNKAAVRGAAYATFYANGPLDLYILAIPTGASTLNDTLCVFNLKTQKWFIWQLTDTVASFLYHTLSSGEPQLLIASDEAAIYELDPLANQDRVNNTAVPFTVTARTTWLDLGDAQLRKFLNEIEVLTGDAAMTVLVEGATTLSHFSATPHTPASRVVSVSPRGEYKVYLAGSTTKDRYYRLTFTSTGTTQNVLGGYSIESIAVNRQ